MAENREHWGSRIGFILAAAGSAIGLGNVWKFPYIAGENGGAAFVFIYLICIAFIGLPVLIGEILLGRTAQRNPVGTFRRLSGKPFWVAVGGMGVAAGFIILSYYSVVGGWCLGYIVESLRGSFFSFQESQQTANLFKGLTANVSWIVGYHALFSLLTIGIVYFGVQGGIERGSKILMPLLFLIIFILVIRGLTLPGSGKGMAFLWNPVWSKVTGKSVLLALGHAFFTLSLGMGAMMTYGSYTSKKDNLPWSALNIVVLDTLIALMAGIAIFTAVFATGLRPDAGPGLIFHTLPLVFNKMPGGAFFAILFFVLLTIAALTSAISLLEVVVAYFVDERGWQRHRAVLVFGAVIFLAGVPSALSSNVLKDFTLFGLTVFDAVDYLAANILLPLGGLMISVFIAWEWGLKKAMEHLRQGAEQFFQNYPWVGSLWGFTVRWVAPLLILLVFLNSIGILKL